MSWGLRSQIRELEQEVHDLKQKLALGEVYITKLEAENKSMKETLDHSAVNDKGLVVFRRIY